MTVWCSSVRRISILQLGRSHKETANFPKKNLTWGPQEEDFYFAVTINSCEQSAHSSTRPNQRQQTRSKSLEKANYHLLKQKYDPCSLIRHGTWEQICIYVYIYFFSLPNVVVGEEPATGRPTTRDGSETLHHITCCSSRVMSAANSHTHLLSTFSRPSLLRSFLSHQRNIRRCGIHLAPSAVSLLSSLYLSHLHPSLPIPSPPACNIPTQVKWWYIC